MEWIHKTRGVNYGRIELYGVIENNNKGYTLLFSDIFLGLLDRKLAKDNEYKV